MKSKTNKTGDLLLMPAAPAAILGSVKNFDYPEAIFEIGCRFLQKTFQPEGIEENLEMVRNTAKILGLKKSTDFVKKTIRSLERQFSMGVEKARKIYKTAHDVVLELSSDLSKDIKIAAAQFRFLIQLADVGFIPAKALLAVTTLLEYQAIEIGVASKAWALGPLTGLRNRISADAANGATNEDGGIQPGMTEEAIRRGQQQETAL